jgi:hypothetical protein
MNEPPPLPGPPPLPDPNALEYASFTEPQAGTFTVDVPRGWQVLGGFAHPYPGDRRMFTAVRSREGVEVLFGDPDCPQAFCHTLSAFEGTQVPYATGCVFLNLPASGGKLAKWYMKQVAPHRFGPVELEGDRPRPDLVEAAYERARRRGIAVPRSIEATTHEMRFRAGSRVGSCFGSSLCDKQAALLAMGLLTSWEGNVLVTLAPPHLTAVAEAVAMRMVESFRTTPRLLGIIQRDEATISANGQVANQNQRQWFAGQQAQHQAQVAQGDAYVQGYWEDQRANDRMMETWDDAQGSNDRVFQGYGDAIRGDQRLYDDTMGKRYDVPNAASYYWLDQGSGQVIGTTTDTPPDDQRNYTQLRKG